MTMRSITRSERGMTLIEASIILSVVAILTAVMAPSVNGYIEQARQARTRADVQAIAEAIQAFISDTGEHMFLENGSDGGTYGDKEPPTRADVQRVDLLVSDGDIPALGSGSESFWTQAVSTATPFLVDTLSNHLVENAPFETTTSRYRTPTDVTITTPGSQNIDFARAESSGFNAPHAWRGPYLRGPVGPDPWGNRYAVNVAFLDPRLDSSPTTISNISNDPVTGVAFTTSSYLRLDVFVLSAGADEEIDTKSAQDGAVPGDDDFIYIVSSNAK